MVTASLRIAIVISFVSLIGYNVRADGVYTYTSLVFRICNGKTYPFWSIHFGLPVDITKQIVKEIPNSPFFDVYDQVTKADYTLYAHGSCDLNLDRDECSTCMSSARDQMFADCSWHSAGAQIELQGCKLRFEEYYFGPPPQ